MKKYQTVQIRNALLLSAFATLVSGVIEAANYTYSVACGTANHSVVTSTATLLVGGAEAGVSGETAATQWLINHGKGGDYLVLRSGGTGSQAGWICDNFGSSIGSAAELSIDSRTGANDAVVAQKIRDAEIIFIAGGDQNLYENYWKDTAVESALNDHLRVSKKPIGGTSAGLAILGQSYYAPAGTGVLAKEILDNPYHVNSNDIFHGDFLLHPQLTNVFTETHLNRVSGSGRKAQTRHGRALGFLARSVVDRNTLAARVVAVDEGTFIALEGDGNAKVYGVGKAYFLSPNAYPERVQSAYSVIWKNASQAVTVYSISGSASGNGLFNFTSWSGSGGSSQYWYTSGGYSGFNCQRGC